MITAPVVRRVVLVICLIGVPGMIATSIADSTGGAMTFGLITATAIVCSIIATAVESSRTGGGAGSPEEIAARLESGITDLVASGTDEQTLRRVVADAVRLGRTSR